MPGSKIKQNTENFRQIIENSGDVIWVLDISTFKITYISPSIFQLNGYTADEMLSRPLKDLVTPESYQFIESQISIKIDQIHQGDTSPASSTIEIEQYHKDGGIVNTEVVTTIIYDENSVPVEILGISRDISQRKHIEKLINLLISVTTTMQAALSPDDIYNAMAVALKKLNIESSVFLYDDTKGVLQTKYLSYNRKVLSVAETLAGIKASEFTIKVDDFPEYQDAIFNRKPIFIDDPRSFVERILPKRIKSLASQILVLLKIPALIIVPIIYEDRVKGILTLQSATLNQADMPAVTMFANHLASSWQRGELFEQFRQENEARKLAEHELTDTGVKYQNILNWSPVGLYHSTPDGKILAVNSSLALMLGYDDDVDLLEQKSMFHLYFNPDDRKKLLSIYKEVGDKALKNNELLWKKKDGAPIWILLTAHSIYNENNQLLYIEGFVQNIDAQKEANLALEKSLSKFRATLESTNDGMLVVSLDGKVTNFNKRFVELWQIPSEVYENIDNRILLNYVSKNFIQPEEFISIINEIYSLPLQDSFDVLELKDGRVFERYSHPQMLDEKPVGRVWSFRDVTEKVKAVALLGKSENQYRILFEGANDAIFIMSQDGFIACNDKTIQIFECEKKENIIGKNPWEFSPEYQPDGIASKEKARNYIGAAYEGKTQNFYWKHQTLKGNLIDCEVSLNRIMFNNEVFLQSIVRDITERMQAENALRESENKFRRIFEESPIGLILSGSGFKFITANQAFVNMLGYSEEELKTMSFKDITHPDHLETDTKAVDKLLTGELLLYRTEKKYITKSGSIVWGSVTITTIHKINGEFLHFLGMIEDITERKKTEIALLESQLQYASVVDNSNDAIIIHQHDKIQFVNAAIEKLTGFAMDDFINVSMIEFIAPEDRETTISNYNNRLKGLESPDIYEVSMLKKNGGLIPVELNASTIKYKGESAGLVFVRDLSERKKAEKEIRDREFWLLQSQKFAMIGTYYLDVHTGEWRCTEILDEIFGIEAGFTKTVETWVSIIYEEDREMMANYFQQHVLGNKQPFDREYRIMRQNDKKVRWVYGRGDLTFDENNETIAMVGTISDINGRKIMEEELTIAKEKAEESSRLKTSLLLNISHELRTPMNGILGFAEILTDTTIDPTQHRMAENILLSGNRLKATLDSIVDLSQVQADAKIIKVEKINLESVIQSVLDNFADIAGTNNILLELSAEPDLFALTDPILLGNVVHHLVDNALKFTDKGSVKISIEKDKSAEYAIISVRDTGIGIARENLEMIFDEFRQVSEGMGRSYEGTGLGLTLCRKFVELMRGEITVESELGVGSVFRVRIPLSGIGDEDTSTTLTGETIQKEKQVHPENLNVPLPLVLLVEDQEYNLELIEIYLEGICETDRALDGLSAVKMAFARKYDAILMDVNLGPGMDGLEASGKIKAIKGYENTPIIAVTGYSTAAEKEHILSQGCTHYLSKPYNRNSLVTIVRESLGI